MTPRTTAVVAGAVAALLAVMCLLGVTFHEPVPDRPAYLVPAEAKIKAIQVGMNYGEVYERLGYHEWSYMSFTYRDLYYGNYVITIDMETNLVVSVEDATPRDGSAR